MIEDLLYLFLCLGAMLLLLGALGGLLSLLPEKEDRPKKEEFREPRLKAVVYGDDMDEAIELVNGRKAQ